MKIIESVINCRCWLLPALAVFFVQSVLGQGIVYIKMPPTVRPTNGPPGTTPVTFPEDALGTYVGDPLSIVINGQTVLTFSSGTSFSVNGTSTSGIISQQPFLDFPDTIWVVLLDAGQQIGPNADGYGWFSGGLLASSTGSGTQGGGPLTGGYFAGAEAAYFGFDFQQDGQTYYGWMDVGSPYVTGTGGVGWLYSYAYETTPNTPIFAGEVPEPSTWVLFGAGGTALWSFRRKQTAAFRRN
jgi:hypothetical protein